MYKFAAGLVALALSVAVVTALAGAAPDGKTDVPSAVKADVAPDTKANGAPEAKADTTPEIKSDAVPAAAPKSDRLAVPKAKPAARPVRPESRPVTSACPQEPWPYGCQWRVAPTRKVIRGSRPS
jgi:hypothetical protein